MPKTKDHVQSIHIVLHANRLSMEEARTVINRFLSLMTWCDDQYAIAQDGWSGNPVPVAVPKRNLAFTTTSHWVFNRDLPVSEDVRPEERRVGKEWASTCKSRGWPDH